MSVPSLVAPANMTDVIRSLDGALCLDENRIVSMGSGRSTRVAMSWSWIVGDVSDPCSDLWNVDGFGRISVCRRSDWDAKKKSYSVLTHGEVRLKVTKRDMSKLQAAIRVRVAPWYIYSVGGVLCYKSTPWTA